MKPIIERLRAVARARPDAIAIRDRHHAVTYRELVVRIDGLACDLRRHLAGTHARIAIHLDRSPEMIIAILATLAAGATYVPLDTDSPLPRLQQILSDCEPAIILTAAQEEAFPVAADIPRLRPAMWSRKGPAVTVDSGGPAYLIYTSGSTGRPKGVVIGHDSLENYLAWAIQELPFIGGGVPLLANIAFDHAVTCYLPPLLMGEAVILLPPLRGGRDLGRFLLTGHRYSYVKITPSHFRLLDREERAQLGISAALVMFGGERVTADLVADVRSLNATLAVMNHYGPTEATVGCCVYRVPVPTPADPIPIGRPLPGVEVHIDPTDAADDESETGELLVGGRALARGYWRLPQQTAGSFVTLPDEQGGERRWYRTGDFVRGLASGDVVFLGRRDEQLKILGHRIDAAEIECALRSHPRVRQVTAFCHERSGGAALIAAVTTSLPRPSEEQLRAHARSLLPSVMVPRHIAILDEFPVNPSGKFDRAAIVQAIEDTGAGTTSATIDEIVAQKFAEALERPRVDLDEDFFELGGDSLATVEITGWLGEHFDIALEPTALFEYPTIRALAQHIRSFPSPAVSAVDRPEDARG